MARVKITLEELEDDLLPGVCALTGQPTQHTVQVRFSSVPWWTHFFFFLGIWYLIEILAHRDYAVVSVPVVREHRFHWLWRRLVWVGLLLLAAGTFVTGVVVACMAPASRGLIWEDVILLLVAAVLLVATAVVKEWLRRSGIHMVSLSRTGVTLANLHPQFVDELHADRRRDELAAQREEEREWEEERARRERRRAKQAAERPPPAPPPPLPPGVVRAMRVYPPPARRVPDPPKKPKDDQEPWW